MLEIWEAEDIPTAESHYSFHYRVLVHHFVSSPSPPANCLALQGFSAILLSRRNKRTLRNNAYCTVWWAVLLCGLGFSNTPIQCDCLGGSRSCIITDGQLAGKQLSLQGKPQALSLIFLKKQLCPQQHHCTPTLAVYVHRGPHPPKAPGISELALQSLHCNSETVLLHKPHP